MTFDPYLKWLGIRDSTRPVSHYRLLGIEDYESDSDVISLAADRQMAHVRRFQNSEHSADSQRLLNEIAAAKVCLLDDDSRTEYNQKLRTAQSTPTPVEPAQSTLLGKLLPIALILLAISSVVIAGYYVATFVGRKPNRVATNTSSKETDRPNANGPVPDKSTTDQGSTNSDTDSDNNPPKPETRRIPVSTVSPWVKQDRAAEPENRFESPFLESLAKRSFENADELLQNQKFLARYSKQQRIQLRRTANGSRRFWKAVQHGVEEAKPGKVLAYRHQPVEVLSNSPEQIILVAGDGSECAFGVDPEAIEFELAISLARPFLPTDSRQAEAIIAIARNLEHRDAEKFAELNVGLVEPPSPTEPSPTERTIAGSPGTPTHGNSSIVNHPATQPNVNNPEDLRAPVPEKLAREKTKPQLRRILADLKEQHPKALIARKLLDSARQTKDVPLRYELLMSARTQGLSNGDLTSSLQASTEVSRLFQVDSLALVKKTISDGSKRIQGKQLSQLVAFGNSHVRKAIAEDDFDGARELSRSLVGPARKTKDSDLARSIRDLKDSIDGIEQNYLQARKHMKVLEDDSENPESNRFIGLFLAADKEDFNAARPYLARSGEQRLVSLSQSPTSVKQRMQAADAWWELAKELKDHRKRNLQNHAFKIYRSVFPQVSGIQKSSIREKISQSLTMEPLLAVVLSQIWRVEWTNEPAWTSLTFDKDGSGIMVAGSRRNDVSWRMLNESIVVTQSKGIVYVMKVNRDGLLDCEKRRLETRKVEGTGLGKPIALSSSLGV